MNPSRFDGYDHALNVLKACAFPATPTGAHLSGFAASPKAVDNYLAVFSRDAAVMTVAALLSGDDELVSAGTASMVALAQSSSHRGQIPERVESGGRPSFSTLVGRIDSSLWWAIACGEIYIRTRDESFLATIRPVLDEQERIWEIQEQNGRGLLYVPTSGDWADEYVLDGYVLYDQLLYLQALRSLLAVRSATNGPEQKLEQKCKRLVCLIRANYWMKGPAPDEAHVYHQGAYERGRKAFESVNARYWAATFGPRGYMKCVDALANALASLFGVASDEQHLAVVNDVVSRTHASNLFLLPAFEPVIEPNDSLYATLAANWSYRFKNEPHHYHNGGIWPMVMGFVVAALAERGNDELAGHYHRGLSTINATPAGDGRSWSFPEYVAGHTLHPGPVYPLGWSAAAQIIASHSLAGQPVFLAARATGGVVQQ